MNEKMTEEVVAMSEGALEEAGYNDKRFQEEIDKLKDTQATGPRQIYQFNPKTLLTRGKALDIMNTTYGAGDHGLHAPDPIMSHVVINKDNYRENTTDGLLYNTEVVVKGKELHITGNGDPKGLKGTATVAFGMFKEKNSNYEYFKFLKLVKDELDGIVVDEDGVYLHKICWEVSNELYGVLKSTFGPTAY